MYPALSLPLSLSVCSTFFRWGRRGRYALKSVQRFYRDLGLGFHPVQANPPPPSTTIMPPAVSTPPPPPLEDETEVTIYLCHAAAADAAPAETLRLRRRRLLRSSCYFRQLFDAEAEALRSCSPTNTNTSSNGSQVWVHYPYPEALKALLLVAERDDQSSFLELQRSCRAAATPPPSPSAGIATRRVRRAATAATPPPRPTLPPGAETAALTLLALFCCSKALRLSWNAELAARTLAPRLLSDDVVMPVLAVCMFFFRLPPEDGLSPICAGLAHLARHTFAYLREHPNAAQRCANDAGTAWDTICAAFPEVCEAAAVVDGAARLDEAAAAEARRLERLRRGGGAASWAEAAAEEDRLASGVENRTGGGAPLPLLLRSHFSVVEGRRGTTAASSPLVAPQQRVGGIGATSERILLQLRPRQAGSGEVEANPVGGAATSPPRPPPEPPRVCERALVYTPTSLTRAVSTPPVDAVLAVYREEEPMHRSQSTLAESRDSAVTTTRLPCGVAAAAPLAPEDNGGGFQLSAESNAAQPRGVVATGEWREAVEHEDGSSGPSSITLTGLPLEPQPPAALADGSPHRSTATGPDRPRRSSSDAGTLLRAACRTSGGAAATASSSTQTDTHTSSAMSQINSPRRPPPTGTAPPQTVVIHADEAAAPPPPVASALPRSAQDVAPRTDSPEVQAVIEPRGTTPADGCPAGDDGDGWAPLTLASRCRGGTAPLQLRSPEPEVVFVPTPAKRHPPAPSTAPAPGGPAVTIDAPPAEVPRAAPPFDSTSQPAASSGGAGLTQMEVNQRIATCRERIAALRREQEAQAVRHRHAMQQRYHEHTDMAQAAAAAAQRQAERLEERAAEAETLTQSALESLRAVVADGAAQAAEAWCHRQAVEAAAAADAEIGDLVAVLRRPGPIHGADALREFLLDFIASQDQAALELETEMVEDTHTYTHKEEIADSSPPQRHIGPP
eukprot:gene1837-1117_t